MVSIFYFETILVIKKENNLCLYFSASKQQGHTWFHNEADTPNVGFEDLLPHRGVRFAKRVQNHPGVVSITRCFEWTIHLEGQIHQCILHSCQCLFCSHIPHLSKTKQNVRREICIDYIQCQCSVVVQ